MRILKVKYTKFTLFLPNSLTNSLPAVKPRSTMARAPVFSHNKGKHVGFTKLLF